MKFSIEFLNYGRYGVVAMEPRTGLRVDAQTIELARDEIIRKLRDFEDYIPPDDGPQRTIETVVI